MERLEFFNSVAETWDERFCTQELLSFLEEFVPQFGLKLQQKVLDVGTGTGLLVPYLMRAVGSKGHVTAIDYSEKMVEICRSKFLQVPNLSVITENVEKLNLEPEAYDAGICFGVFPHFENKYTALLKINQVLKPMGKLVIAHALGREELNKHHFNADPAVAQDILPDAEQIKELLIRAGFGRIQIIDQKDRYLNISFKIVKNSKTGNHG